MSSIHEIKAELGRIITPELLVKVHNLVVPWEKANKIDWETLGQKTLDDDPDRERIIYQTLFSNVWRPISKMPLEVLLQIDMTDLLPEPDAPDYPEQCFGLIHIFDQTRPHFVDTDKRYTNSFFDPLCLKLVKDLHAVQDQGFQPPQALEAWSSRGYTFDDWIARSIWLIAPFTHSESYTTENRSDIKTMLHELRSKAESASGVKDLYASQESSDEKNVFLFDRFIRESPPSKEQLGRDVEMYDFAFWMIRLDIAHLAVTDRFGRYPYRNDAVGRDYVDGELEWQEKQEALVRLDEDLRARIRRDVDAGVWSPLRGNPHFERN